MTAITLGEIRYGFRTLPQGLHRQRLEESFERVIAAAFTGRILAFGEEAAAHYGEVMARRKELGRPLSVPDGQIAAIARQHGFAVATTGRWRSTGPPAPSKNHWRRRGGGNGRRRAGRRGTRLLGATTASHGRPAAFDRGLVAAVT